MDLEDDFYRGHKYYQQNKININYTRNLLFFLQKYNEYLDEKSVLDQLNYCLTKSAKNAFTEYINLRKEQPHFANARSIRNALDRVRLRQANRLFKENDGPVDAEKLSTLEEVDIRESRVFSGGIDN